MKRDLPRQQDHPTSATDESEDEFMEEVEYNASAKTQSETFLPGDPIPEGMSLDWDRSCYTMMHEATTEWPCLSFDFLSQPCKDSWPMAIGLVAGSQAAEGHSNSLYVIHAANLTRTWEAGSDDDDEDEEDDSDDEDETGDPQLSMHAQIPHEGSVNRLRVSHSSQRELCASWSDLGKVFLWDLSSSTHPLASLSMDGIEGYGIAFRSTDSALLAGSCSGAIKLWSMDSSSIRESKQHHFQSPYGSVEDLQWSPSEESVFAAASGASLALWDLRSGKVVVEHPRAHAGADVNVLSWNSTVQYLIATGGDEGTFKIWDLRMGSGAAGGDDDNGQAEIASIDWHKRGNDRSITSIEWKDSSVLAVSDSHDQVTIWDMSLESDETVAAEAEAVEKEEREIPPQLLFIHQGMQQVKEIHWHPRISGLIGATALSGFNVFQTINVK